MTLRDIETRLTNLEAQVSALASRPYNEKSEAACRASESARSEAKEASNKAESFEDAITTMALAQEELFTEIIPELLEEKEA